MNPPHIGRKTIIGTSLGIASLLILVILAFLFVKRIRRQRSGKLVGHDDSRFPLPLDNLRVFTICSVPEIENNTIYEPIRELPDSSKAELPDERHPSRSSNRISEICQPRPPTIHELKSHITPRQHSMVHTHTVNTGRIFMSTKVSRRNETSTTSRDSTPHVETVIPASSHLKNDDSRLASVHSSNAAAEIYSLYLRTSPSLGRSSPPTPISESPQTSPIFNEFDRRNSFRPRSRSFPVPAHDSMSAFVSPSIPSSRYPATPRRHERHPVSVLLTGLEIAVPPGQSDPTSPTTLASSQGLIRTSKNWV